MSDLVHREEQRELTTIRYSPEKLALMKRTVCKGASDDQLELFLHVAQRTGLDPFARQIYAVMRWNSTDQCYDMVIQTGIDGFRLTASRSKRHNGTTPPEWFDDQGEGWVDVWLRDYPPAAAKIGVYVEGASEPTYGVAMYKEYVQYKKDGTTIVSMWRNMPANQLAKCAEAQALRKAFPAELSGMYADDEMQQADNPPPPESTVKQPRRTTDEEPPHTAEEADSQDAKVVEGDVWCGLLDRAGVMKKGKKQGGAEWTKYGVAGKDGAEFQTFSKTDYETAVELIEAGSKTVIEFERNQYGLKILEIRKD